MAKKKRRRSSHHKTLSAAQVRKIRHAIKKHIAETKKLEKALG
jgi:hypothetical protein